MNPKQCPSSALDHGIKKYLKSTLLYTVLVFQTKYWENIEKNVTKKRTSTYFSFWIFNYFSDIRSADYYQFYIYPLFESSRHSSLSIIFSDYQSTDYIDMFWYRICCGDPSFEKKIERFQSSVTYVLFFSILFGVSYFILLYCALSITHIVEYVARHVSVNTCILFSSYFEYDSRVGTIFDYYPC